MGNWKWVAVTAVACFAFNATNGTTQRDEAETGRYEISYIGDDKILRLDTKSGEIWQARVNPTSFPENDWLNPLLRKVVRTKVGKKYKVRYLPEADWKKIPSPNFSARDRKTQIGRYAISCGGYSGNDNGKYDWELYGLVDTHTGEIWVGRIPTMHNVFLHGKPLQWVKVESPPQKKAD